MGTTNYSSIYTRFEQIASHYGLSFRALGKRLNLSSAQVFYDMKSGKTQGVSRKILESVRENLPEINPSWLVTGDGEMLNSSKKKIPLYDDVTIGGVNEQAAIVDDASRPTEWIDAGDWFPSATSAIHHYGDSMVEYPSGCVLLLKRVNDPNLLLNGENYVIETEIPSRPTPRTWRRIRMVGRSIPPSGYRRNPSGIWTSSWDASSRSTAHR